MNSFTLPTNVSHTTRPSTRMSDTKNKEEEEEVMVVRDQTTTAANNESTIPYHPFIPYGILKLPQSIASALASDFLTKLEIRSLSVTCRWMIVSLRDCSINEPISLPSAIHRLDQQPSSRSPSERTTNMNVRIGRFKNVHYRLLQQSRVTKIEMGLLAELYRLVDCHKFTLRLSDIFSSDIKEKLRLYLPLFLPPRLQVFHVENIGNSISIGDFVLPSSLRRIEIDPLQNPMLVCLSKVRWPTKPFKLKELIGIFIDLPLRKVLSLPNALTTVSFREYQSCVLSNVVFPNLITDLSLPVSHDQNGRYRNLVFPSSLKRLVFTGEMGKDDFELTQWTHLPSSCTNLELKLRSEVIADLFEPHPTDVEILPSSPIVIPPFVEQLRIQRVVAPTSQLPQWQLPQLQLSHASSLKSLATDSLEQIEWPAESSSALKSLKPMVSCEELLRSGVPSSVQFIDLTSVPDWNDDVSSDDYHQLHSLYSNITHLVAPLNPSTELINENVPGNQLVPLFRQVLRELFGKYATTAHPFVQSDPHKKTMSKLDLANYFLSCGDERSSDRDSINTIFTDHGIEPSYDQLAEEGFCEFYREECVESERLDAVWNDLRVHGYSHHLIHAGSLAHVMAWSRALPSALVEGRILVDPQISVSSQLLSQDGRFECYYYLNGVPVPRGDIHSYRQQEEDEARFDLKPTEIE